MINIHTIKHKPKQVCNSSKTTSKKYIRTFKGVAAGIEVNAKAIDIKPIANLFGLESKDNFFFNRNFFIQTQDDRGNTPEVSYLQTLYMQGLPQVYSKRRLAQGRHAIVTKLASKFIGDFVICAGNRIQRRTSDTKPDQGSLGSILKTVHLDHIARQFTIKEVQRLIQIGFKPASNKAFYYVDNHGFWVITLTNGKFTINCFVKQTSEEEVSSIISNRHITIRDESPYDPYIKTVEHIAIGIKDLIAFADELSKTPNRQTITDTTGFQIARPPNDHYRMDRLQDKFEAFKSEVPINKAELQVAEENGFIVDCNQNGDLTVQLFLVLPNGLTFEAYSNRQANNSQRKFINDRFSADAGRTANKAIAEVKSTRHTQLQNSVVPWAQTTVNCPI